MSENKMTKTVIFTVIMILGFTFLSAQENVIEIRGLYNGECDFSTFSIKEKTFVNIEIKGARTSIRGPLCTYTWILDAHTRKPIWELDEYKILDMEKFRRTDDYILFTLKEKIDLKPGDYEIYFFFLEQYKRVNILDDAFEWLFKSKKGVLSSYDRRNLGVKLTGSNKYFIPQRKEGYIKELIDKSIVSINRVGNNFSEKIGFKLDKGAEVKIYCIGEASHDEEYDYGWIIDANNHRKVWTFEPEFSDFAGGAPKNRMYEEIITLPKGEYLAFYVSDDSHSFDEWNEIPPYDPVFWGITIWGFGKDFKRDIIKPFKGIEENEPIIELTRVGDDESVSQGFTLNKPMKIRILALGEQGYSNNLVDYGWIMDADTRELIWKMNPFETIHAGGAQKNRLFDKTIQLNAGNYIAFYSTDDSHSYIEWNDPPPFEPERWGITIWPVSKDFRPSDIEKFDADRYKAQNIITQIIRIMDNEELEKHFTLEDDTKIRIYAIGEGSRNQMYDFCWIENAVTRDVIWEMTYRKTEHAGGAEKNRMYNGVIMLPAGEYKVVYVSDGSHSYRDWNEAKPFDPENYGVTIYRAK